MAKMWEYGLGDSVKLTQSDEHGVVIARAEYLDGSPDSYLVRYKAGDGRVIEQWWADPALEIFYPEGN